MTGREVKRIRNRLGLTQAEFSKLVGVHLVTVSRWENNRLGIRESAARLMRLIAKTARWKKSKKKK